MARSAPKSLFNARLSHIFPVEVEPIRVEKYLPRHNTPVSLGKQLKRATPERKAALLGLAFDAEDGHKRLTRGDNFVLFGGSQETHAVMQETAIKVNEHLDRSGKRLEDVSLRELRDICHEVMG